jgi:hypothetical protein
MEIQEACGEYRAYATMGKEEWRDPAVRLPKELLSSHFSLYSATKLPRSKEIASIHIIGFDLLQPTIPTE